MGYRFAMTELSREVRAMGEPKRWTLESRHDEHANQHYWRLGDGPEPVGSEDIPVREDRATEADREKIARRLAEYAAHELGLEVEILDHHFETADELLALVFGEEASRV
jgi:hypothetical protein